MADKLERPSAISEKAKYGDLPPWQSMPFRCQLKCYKKPKCVTDQKTSTGKNKGVVLDAANISGVIEMALSDHVSFETIKNVFGLAHDDVKFLMRQNLKPGSYRAWRKRVSTFGSRRARYKSGRALLENSDDLDDEELQPVSHHKDAI